MKSIRNFAFVFVCVMMSSCGIIEENSKYEEAEGWEFGQDISFLTKYADCVVLGGEDSFILVSPKLQGRVMTSTLDGADGKGIGWINRNLIANGRGETYLMNYGGEDRLWVGPEGSDYSIFFEQGDMFISDKWKVPSFMSSEAWETVSRTGDSIALRKSAKFANMRGTKFDISLERDVSILNRRQVTEILGLEIPESVKMVSFQSYNKIINKGIDWSEKTGLLNIGVLSCYSGTKDTFVFVPYNEGSVDDMGNIIKDDYFDSISEERLFIEPSFIKTRVDGRKVYEYGINPRRSKGIVGSYNAERNLLTIITYVRTEKVNAYLNASIRRSMSNFDGDVITVFNNGPIMQGSFNALPFYEISTYSPALMLIEDGSQIHVQRTFHFQGSEYELGRISEKLLGVSMKQLRTE